MKKEELEQILCRVQSGEMEIGEAVSAIKLMPFRDLGYAKVDIQRELRQGTAEVIYGEGKSAGQIRGIVQTMRQEGQETILITRLSGEKAGALTELPLTYYREAQIGVVGVMPEPEGDGKIVVATGGTSDLRVAEEAALTAETFGNRVVRLYDVGVAGIHRLLANAELLMDASVVIVAAGMEGALASVVGGLVDCPVIAVPTSVGYGVAAGGYAALMSMLSSCASGVSVVNIDNGYGAGYLASMINRRTQRR
ncbi:MAG: nickel pincer cofactor biosynthesis protein LarB [Muribaculaceae bacterium]|nr:nickel pincer cofactor biosynthesis protein LarB [Roseburia sp.]MCM1431132.1 nickel pincer cofactor biosynthesis protein LarB [Muribaculaceae bacterium]MCM1492555.1 nickel pincer cofactor biosynthesis protein LarB [Muribaculaceae bacterium]